MIELKRCVIGYHKPLLRDVTLKLEKGQCYSLVGKSGTGKSTLLHLISGLKTASRHIKVFEGTMVVKPDIRTAFVFQSFDQLFPWQSVLKNTLLSTYQSPRRTTKKEALIKARSLLKEVGLSEVEQAYPHALSGGMKQRVAIARALLSEPDLLILDEPLSSVDENTRLSLRDFIKDIIQKHQCTVVIATHHLEDAVYLSDHVITLSQEGRVQTLEIRDDIDTTTAIAAIRQEIFKVSSSDKS